MAGSERRTYRFRLDATQGDTPWLTTTHEPGPLWNGWDAPVATEAEVRAYVAAMVANDSDAVWTGEVLVEDEGVLIRRTEEFDGDDDLFATSHTCPECGDVLYDLAGFVWEREGKWDDSDD